MSVLSVIQNHCQIHALSVPSGVVNATDTQTQQLLAILQELLDDIAGESKYNVATQEAVFSTIPGMDQGSMDSLAPNGYAFAIFETFFDRTLMRALTGPVDESEWQALMALPSAGTWYKFRIRQNHLLLYPVPGTTSDDIAFEYMSKWLVTDANGNLKSSITADTDLFILPENIIRKGLMFRWKQVKGLPYQVDESRFWELLNNYIAKDKVKRRIDLANPYPNEIKPGVMVPTNTWPVHN
jgi:hypothetical protein